jgi:hypothetical protein
MTSQPLTALEKINLTLDALAQAKDKQRFGAKSGVLICPVCGGDLNWSAASGKKGAHTRGQCATDGCVRWIE